MEDKIKVLVVGDVVFDIYVSGDSERVSPEAPVPVMVKEKEEYLPGGAGNVAANFASLGVETYLAGVIGKDRHASLLKKSLRKLRVNYDYLFETDKIPTATKIRFVSRNQQLLRVDEEAPQPAGNLFNIELLIRKLRPLVKKVDAVVFSDYGKGFLDARLCRELIRSAGFSVAGLKGNDFTKYRGVQLFSLNKSEASSLTGEKDHIKAAKKLKRMLSSDIASVTLGKDGIYLEKEHGFIAPARARSVYDVTGAGDTVLAMLVYCFLKGYSPEETAVLANEAAAIVIEQFGTSTVTFDEVLRNLYGTNKIIRRSDVRKVVSKAKKENKKIVFTNGCFDILHAGHVDLLRFAKSRGDLLIVGINSDNSVRMNKGSKRPIVGLSQRCQVLSSVKDVDYVVPFDEKTPLRLIQAIEPDVLIKGEDWKNNIVGKEFVEKKGGRVEVFRFKTSTSTSSILNKLGKNKLGTHT